MIEYKVVVYKEGLFGSIFFGSARVDPVRFSNFLNENADAGWRVVTMEKDIRRELLFFNRESYVVVMERSKA